MYILIVSLYCTGASEIKGKKRLKGSRGNTVSYQENGKGRMSRHCKKQKESD